MKPLAVLTPKGIAVEELVSSYSAKLDVNYLRYIIHYILSRMAMLIENENERIKSHWKLFDTYIPIYTKRLLVGTKKHREHIRFLGTPSEDTGNVLYRKDYSKGKSYSYKLSPRYDSQRLKYDFIDSKVFSRRIVDSMSKVTPVVKHNNGKYHFLFKFFNREKLTIDIDRARVLSQHRYAYYKDYKKHLSEMNLISELYNGIYRIYHQEETDARIHTNLTRLPKPYRKFVSYEGKKLVEVDLSNSIIYFLALLVNNKQEDNLFKLFPLLYMFINSFKTIANSEKELLLTLATEGGFYEEFIEPLYISYPRDKYMRLYEIEFGEAFTGSYEQKRNFTKKRLLAMLFAGLSSYKIEQMVFKRIFPTIHEGIRHFKKENGYKKFAHLLMQIESHYMLNVVARAFNRKYFREAPIFSLHDCLITTEDYQEQLEALMRNEFLERFGIAPKFKSAIW
jgi:hypothetical protein